MEISNNLAENAFRPFVVGRKNWLFLNMPKGADSNAIVYTLVETAKSKGVELYAYLLGDADSAAVPGEESLHRGD